MSDPIYINPLHEEVSPSDFENLGSLAEDMVYRLPGCADVMIRKTLQDVYKKFCEMTWALRTITKQPLIEGQVSYRVIIPSQTYVLRIVKVKKGNTLLRELHQYTTITGQPVQVVLKSVPTDSDAGVELTVETVCVPTRGSEDLPTWFSTMYGGALVNGALFRLMAMSDKPWTDKDQAKIEGIEWQNALNDASAKSIAGSSQVGNEKIDTINYGGMI